MEHTTTRNADLFTITHMGQNLAVFVFILTLLAGVIESELAQYVQTTLNYRQPFFLFYIVHSSFSLVFPFHMLYLLATTSHTASSLMRGLSVAISTHLAPSQKRDAFRFPVAKFLRLTLALTFGITVPAFLWFASVSLASITDVTAIWNTNAFFVYIISVKLFKLQWESKRLMAVVLATLGTFAVVYGGATTSKDNPKSDDLSTTTTVSYKPSAPLIGNLLTLVASFGYGLYQVLYKIYAALPSEAELVTDRLYNEIAQDDEAASVEIVDVTGPTYPPPFGLHPNLITSVLGLFTLIILWIILPFLHWSGVEPFRLPQNKWITLTIAGIAVTGLICNAGMMVLLGVWGPIIFSVGNLLTIVLVLIADVLFGPGMEVLTFWSLIGSGTIVLAFAVLSYDILTKKT